MPGGQPTDLVRSVSRAFRVLEEVGRSPDGISPKRVARRCGLHLSTAYHLLRTLRYEGYVERLPTGDYVLGLQVANRFAELASALSAPPPVVDTMRRFSLATGHSAYLARFVEGQVAITEVVPAPESPRLEELVIGFHGAAHATALGKALLSTLSPAQRQDYVDERGLAPLTGRTVRGTVQLEEELAVGQRTGVFVEEGQYHPEVSCAAVLVPVHRQWAALAVSAHSRVFRHASSQLIPSLHAAANDLDAAPRGR